MTRESIYKHYVPAINSPPQGTGQAYWFVFSANRLLLKIDSNAVGIPNLKNLAELHLSPVRTQYLGTLCGDLCFSAELAPGTAAPAGMTFGDLSSLYGALEEDLFHLAGKAHQIISWDQTHQYCGRCGTKTGTMNGERAKKCPACGLLNYPRITPAAITAVFKGSKILLSHNVAFRQNIHSLVAGFVEPGETLEECIHREIMEEVGLKVKDIKYFGSQPWPFPNSLMIGFTAEYESGEISVDGNEISEAAWYDANNLPELPSKMSIARKMIDSFILTGFSGKPNSE